MLKLLPPDTNKYFNFKCGEIYCLTSTTYNVACCLCGSKVSFAEFPEHFQDEHLSQKHKKDSIDKNNSNVIADKNFKEDPIDNESEGEGDYDNRPVSRNDEMEDEMEDEKPFDIEELECLANETCVGEIDLGIPIVKSEGGSSENDEKRVNKTNVDIWENDNFDDLNDSEEDNVKEAKKIELFQCNLCDRVYKSKRSLQNHVRANHNPTRSQKTPQLKHKCDECGQMFRSERHLRGHKWKHTGIYCDICGKPFTQTGNMLRHKIRHTGIKAHKCKECENCFYTEKELRAHMLRHTGIMPIICEICGRPCRDHGVLTAHMRRHTGERPAKCEVCGKSFYSFHDLNVHAVTHSSERPFSCDICGSTFQRKKSLRVHKKLHTKERKFECKICGKAFAQSGGLNAHMRTHDPATRKSMPLNVNENANANTNANTNTNTISGVVVSSVSTAVVGAIGSTGAGSGASAAAAAAAAAAVGTNASAHMSASAGGVSVAVSSGKDIIIGTDVKIEIRDNENSVIINDPDIAIVTSSTTDLHEWKAKF